MGRRRRGGEFLRPAAGKFNHGVHINGMGGNGVIHRIAQAVGDAELI
jgi:hypothetical protein